MALCGLGWILAHLESGPEALKQWLAVLGGETELKLKTPTYAAGGNMLAACAWFGAAVALWLSRFWLWNTAKRNSAQDNARPLMDRGFFLGVGLIILLALFIRWPRMNLSLYNDEVDVFRTSIEGDWRGKDFFDLESDELPEFRPVSWQETVWGNRIGNNHSLHSILARAGYDTWHRISGQPEGAIAEWPLRLPPLILGLISIGAIAVLARLLTGNGRAGWIVAFLLAIHPWHLRYSTEARGYGMVFGFSTLAILFLALAVQRGGWRWWLGFGAAQMATLWSCFGSLHLILALNLVAGAAFLWPRRDPVSGRRLNPLRSETLPCWVVANVLSACLFLLAAAPLLPPIRLAIETNPTFSQGPVSNWWRNTLTYFLVGMPWTDGDPESAANPAMRKYFGNIFIVAGFALSIALTLTGMLRLLWRGGFAGRLAVLVPALGVFLLWFTSETGGSTALIWYGNFATPFFALWMGIGLYSWVHGRSQSETAELRSRDRITWQRLAIYGLLALYATAVARPLIAYRSHSKQALREAIELARGSVYPFSDEEKRALVAGWWTHANFYDPNLRVVHTADGLEQFLNRARTENRPLFFILGAQDVARAEDPKVIARLEDPAEFEKVAILPGLEEKQFRTWIYRLRPKNQE